MNTAGLRCALLLLAMLAGVAEVAHGQTPELQPSDALKCLSHTKGQGQQPAYPIAEFNANQGGRVQVELEFSRPDKAPEVTVLMQQAAQPFVDAVFEHLRGLRVPCLDSKGHPVRLKQDFTFAADGRQVRWSDPADADSTRRAVLLDCLIHTSGWSRPPYPGWAERRQLQGRVLASLRFNNASDPPVVAVFSRDYASGLADEVKDWLKSTRLPCHEGGPIAGVWVFKFVIEGDHYGFKDLSFSQFLGRTKGIRSQALVLDTSTMGCPFDLRLVYRQPAMPNAVGEVGEPDPARRPLLEWMATAELDLNRTAMDSIFGDTANITVPCLKIDLKPQEKS